MDFGLFIISLGFFLGILSQNAIGFGASYFVLPLIPLFFEIKFFVPILIMLYTINTAIFAIREWKKADKEILTYIIPVSTLGIFLGTYFLVNVDEDQLKKFLAVIIIFLGIYLFFSDRIRNENKVSLLWAIPAGFLSGVLSNISVANPPIILLFKLRKMKKANFYATTGTLFLFTNFFVLLSFALNGLVSKEQIFIAMKLVPLMFLAIFIGKKLNQQIPEKIFQNIISIFLIISGFLLMMKG